jgi:Domain of unknown function (DUF4838)
MNRVSRLLTSAAVLTLLFIGSARADELQLASDGRFLMDLVLDPALDAAVREDFVRVLSAITGTEPRVVGKLGTRPAIIAGVSTFAPFAGWHDDLIEGDTIRISVVHGNIHLTGGTPQAAHFAIYAFLEDLGCRWFMPQAIGEVIPDNPALTWEVDARQEEPDFEYRQIWWAYGGPQETAAAFRQWLLRNRVAFPGVMHGHNLTNTVPPEEFFDDHPEYYALVNGERMTSQLCTSNPEVIRLSIERINAYFDEHPHMLSYSLCPDDNTDFCECANCTALDAGGLDKYYELDKPVLTDRLMVYLNAVAQGIQERHPGKMVTTYAYVNYSTPPVREKIDPHVSIVFTTSVYCSGHSIGDPACESRRNMKRDLAGWAEACDHVYIYEYDPTPYNAELPFPMFGTHARAMPVYRDMGIRGFSYESHNSWATLFPNHYVSARLMWDSDQDYDALLDNLCGTFFGKGGKAMRRYYDEMDRVMREYDVMVEWGQNDYPLIFTQDVMAKCRACLDEARAAAVDPMVKSRLGMVNMGFGYLESYLVCRNAAAGGVTYEDYKKARKACQDSIDAMYAVNKDFIMAEVARDHLNKQLSTFETAQFGRELGLVNDWMLIGPFDHTNRRGHDAVYPPETETDFTKAYEGKDGVTVRWFEFDGPEWAGSVDLAIQIKPKDWATAYAACYVTSPKPQEVQFRVGSNDSVKVWLDDEEVWDNPIPGGRGVMLDDDIVPVTLPEGTSRILVKVSNLGVNWGFCFRITDAEGSAIPGLEYAVGR